MRVRRRKIPGEPWSRLFIADFSLGVSTDSRNRQEAKNQCFAH